jgi:bifunctional DNA-binding transcriptional regulator/antitoxin component of YhaV-PrlF toxin-antitoxin module
MEKVRFGFYARLQAGGRVQIPVRWRWYHRLKPGALLWVTVRAGLTRVEFLTRMGRDGRFTISRVEREVLEIERGDIVKVDIEVEESGEG